MKTIYFISGLGADERVFKFLQLKEEKQVHIRWEIPKRNESLEDYCKKLIKQIDIADEIILIGVSFGGIIAQEIAKIIPVKKIIIISSIKTHHELAWPLNLVRSLKLYTIPPPAFFRWSNMITADYFFSAETKEESVLLHKIIEETDLVFMKWAIRKIMKWKNDSYPQNLVHIHGSKDRIFPFGKIKNAIIIPDAGHFMIANRAKEMEAIIESEMAQIESLQR